MQALGQLYVYTARNMWLILVISNSILYKAKHSRTYVSQFSMDKLSLDKTPEGQNIKKKNPRQNIREPTETVTKNKHLNICGQNNQQGTIDHCTGRSANKSPIKWSNQQKCKIYNNIKRWFVLFRKNTSFP